MRKAILFFSLASITLVAVALPTSTFATDARQAIGMCDKRGSDCKMTTNEKGDTTLCVNNTGGKECVQCPLQGDCVPLGKKDGSKGKIGSVSGVFTGAKGPVGNPPPKRKQPVVGGLKPPRTGVKSSRVQSDTMLHTNNSQRSSGGSHK